MQSGDHEGWRNLGIGLMGVGATLAVADWIAARTYPDKHIPIWPAWSFAGVAILGLYMAIGTLLHLPPFHNRSPHTPGVAPKTKDIPLSRPPTSQPRALYRPEQPESEPMKVTPQGDPVLIDLLVGARREGADLLHRASAWGGFDLPFGVSMTTDVEADDWEDRVGGLLRQLPDGTMKVSRFLRDPAQDDPLALSLLERTRRPWRSALNVALTHSTASCKNSAPGDAGVPT